MRTIWILVHSHSGIINEPEIFYSIEESRERKNELLKKFDEHYDEIEIFETLLTEKSQSSEKD